MSGCNDLVPRVRSIRDEIVAPGKDLHVAQPRQRTQALAVRPVAQGEQLWVELVVDRQARVQKHFVQVDQEAIARELRYPRVVQRRHIVGIRAL